MADGTEIEAFWLPALPGAPAPPELEYGALAFGPGRVAAKIPSLTPQELSQELGAVRTRGLEVLGRLPAAEIIDAVAEATRGMVERGSTVYQELVAVLPRLTGYSQEMIELGLERMGANWTSTALREALVGEFGSLDVLDDFQPRAHGGRQRAFGPALTVHVFSGNIPGVAVSSLIRALCVKSPSFGKTAAGEPYSAVCFARALASVNPDLADCVAVAYWPGGSLDLEQVAFREAEAVIAYGSDDAIDAIRRLVPSHARFLPYPNRLGVGLISRRVLTGGGAEELAVAVAKDVSTFDQHGCVSPHAIYVERGGDVSPVDLARRVADALAVLAHEIPRGTMSPGESSLIHQLRGQAEIRGAEVIASQKGTEWTVIVEQREHFEPSPLNRVIHITAVDDLTEALAALTRVGRHLQTVAFAAEPEEVEMLAERLGAIGATRLVPIGEAAWPSPGWHHDGRFQFVDLVRFVDLEM
jgi:hypothetical protein